MCEHSSATFMEDIGIGMYLNFLHLVIICIGCKAPRAGL